MPDSGHFAGIASESVGSGPLDGRDDAHPLHLGHRTDEHLPHPAGGADPTDSEVRHRSPPSFVRPVPVILPHRAGATPGRAPATMGFPIVLWGAPAPPPQT